MRHVSDLLPFRVTARWQKQQLALVKVETPSSSPSFSRCVQEKQVSTEARGRFGSWGPSRLFRHSLFSPSKNTSEAAFLPHGASEFHSILLSAAQSDLRSCLIYCTSRQRACAHRHRQRMSHEHKCTWTHLIRTTKTETELKKKCI